jgi:hypothetical protein
VIMRHRSKMEVVTGLKEAPNAEPMDHSKARCQRTA